MYTKRVVNKLIKKYMTTKINDIKVLQSAIVDLMDGKYNTGDNDTGLSDARFMDLVALKDAILNTK